MILIPISFNKLKDIYNYVKIFFYKMFKAKWNENLMFSFISLTFIFRN